MKSIRGFLVAGILATLVLYNFIAALRGYQDSMQEAELLFDNQLLDLSQLVANLDLRLITREFRLGNNLAFQVWQGDLLLAASHHAPATPMNAFEPGFDYANFDGYRWRTFTRFDERNGRWMMVAERSDLRYVLAENVVLESITPVLLGIPLAGLLIWLLVGSGLKPLQLLSEELRQKRAQDLSPLLYRKTASELDQVVQSVNGLISRLGLAFEREKRFSADAAHELRTPISALKIQLHNLSQEVDTRSEAFLQLQQGVERMQHLVEQLLSLYRSTPEQFAANRSRIDLLALTQEVVARLYPLMEGRQQILELEGNPAFISGDRFALETLVENLVNNASKYTQAGGCIRIRLEQRQGRVCLVVADNGPGIPAEERARVFERFYRSGTAVPAGVSGCGLGLAIVRHVVDLHEAQLSVEDSGMDSGVAFRVCFPEAADAA
jgi:two-component system, OmpR family, sensor histidine kinase QseC